MCREEREWRRLRIGHLGHMIYCCNDLYSVKVANKLLVPFTVELVVGPTGYLIDIRHVHGMEKIEERGPSQC